jgi:DNA topoisomerase-1
VSLKKEDNPYKIELDRAIELIEEKREKDRSKTIKIFEEDQDMQLLNGRWGPYISYKKKNYRLPKGTNAEELSFKQCLEIVEGSAKTDKSKKTKGKVSAKRQQKKQALKRKQVRRKNKIYTKNEFKRLF